MIGFGCGVDKNLKLNKKVYRKLNRYNNTVPYDSAVTFAYKLAAYRYYVNHAFEICTESNLDN